jgi:hypothetical protein
VAAAHSVGRAAGERAAGLGDGEQLLDCYPACAVVPKDVNGAHDLRLDGYLFY